MPPESCSTAALSSRSPLERSHPLFHLSYSSADSLRLGAFGFSGEVCNRNLSLGFCTIERFYVLSLERMPYEIVDLRSPSLYHPYPRILFDHKQNRRINLSSWKIVAIIALVLAIGAFSAYGVLADEPDTDTPQQEVPPHDESVDPSVTLETPETVPYPDSALTAAALEVSTAEVISELTAQDAFDDYVERVIEQFPGQVAGIWMDSPNGSSVNTRGNIRFKGEVPAGITIMENVRLIGGGGLTLDDHYRRADEVEEALWNYTAQLGYEYLSGYEPDVDKIVIMMQIPEADSASVPSIADFLAAFNQHLGSVSELRGTAAGTLLTADDIQLDITIKDGPMISFLSA